MKFHYQARTNDGKTQIGVIEASSKEAALEILGRYGLYVTLLEATREAPFYARRLGLFEHVSSKEIMLFFRELSIMFRAQVSLLEGLRVLTYQLKNARLKEILADLSEAVEGGTALSAGLAKYPDAFPPFAINMIKSGEASGKLSETLEYLAEHMEREYAISNKIKAAATYPVFVVFVTIAILFLLMYFVVPNLTKVLQSTGQQLPFLTRVIVGLSAVVQKWGLIILFGTGAAMWGFLRLIRQGAGKKWFHGFILRLPVLGGLLRMTYLTKFAENLSTLITGGLPIVQALEIVRDIVGNIVYMDIIDRAKEEVSKGNKISGVLRQYPEEFPPLFTQMITVGETSGTLDAVLLDVVRFYQKEVMTAIDSFLNLLEPLLIVVLGAVVGGIMAALIIPMYQISTGG